MRPIILLTCVSALCLAQQSTITAPLARNEWIVKAEHQTTDGRLFHAQGHVELLTAGLRFRADVVDIDETKTTAHLVGHVIVEAQNKGTLTAEEADYDWGAGDLRLKLTATH